jgi:small subunit ribosomal protein S4
VARYIGPQCKLCRREGMKLFLKGDRCGTDKCGVSRRPYPPGQHGQRRQKATDYGGQLREKQKAKRIYGLQERQFRNYFHKADQMKGVTGENLLRLLERRLDNVVYRMGFAGSRAQARLLVRHNHVRVNGKKVDIPAYLVRVGDRVSVKEKSRALALVQEAAEAAQSRLHLLPWIEVEAAEFVGTVKAYPTRAEIDTQVNEQLIVELYSR